MKDNVKKFIKKLTKLSKKYQVYIGKGEDIDSPILYGTGTDKNTTYINLTYKEEDKKYLVYTKMIPIYYESYWTRMKDGVLIREDMHIEKFVSSEEAEEYPFCYMQDNFLEFWNFVKAYLVEYNIKMTGYEHQTYGIPLIKYKTETYAFSLSCEKWGQIMAEAFEPDKEDETAYFNWAWSRPDGEKSWINPDYEKKLKINESEGEQEV